LIFNINLKSNEKSELGNFQCQEGHFVKIGTNFVREFIRPVAQTPVPAEKTAVMGLE
jgi:hypothetical protein